MRLPGFYHCKQEPILVECIKFDPDLKYTQDELLTVLPKVEVPDYDITSRTEFGGVVGSGQRLMDKCEFCKHCKDNAANLSEPEWYAFVTNMALSCDGTEFVHDVSRPYPKYSKSETDDKIRHAIKENKPHTCEYIKTRLNFTGCCDCNVKAPIALAVLSLSEQAAELAESEITDDMIFEDKTIELMAYAKKHNPIAYAKFKQKLKGRCSIRDFEAAVNFKSRNVTIVEDIDIVTALNEHGDYVLWKSEISHARKNTFARFLISASFASVLLLPLNHRVFFIHIWHDSKSGKTAAIKAGISVWGDPLKLMGSFNATSVGLERKAGTLNHLPFAIDELQVLNEKRLSSETIIYGLSNGFGRLRGSKEGGVQEMVTWKNIILTSGEQALSKENSNDGVLTRVFELYGKPVANPDDAHELHILSENNYGFAGKEYMKFITSMKDTDIISDYGKMCAKLIELYGKSSYVDSVSVVCLGDYYASISVFKADKETAWNEALELGIKILNNNEQLKKTDTVSRAWDFVIGWITSNYSKFSADSNPCYGTIENGKCYVIPSCLRNALEENNFDYGKITRGFKERGLLETFADKDGNSRMQTTKRINGVPAKVCVIKLPEDTNSITPLT